MPKYWGVRVGHGGQYADIARKNGYVAIGWDELGDLSWLSDAQDEAAARQKLASRCETTFGVTGMKAAITAGQLWRFARDIQVGDIVFLPNAAKGRVHVGVVAGLFENVVNPTDGCPYSRRRKVTWVRDLDRSELPAELRFSLGSLTTVFSLARVDHFARAAADGAIAEVGATVKVAHVDVLTHVLDRLYGLHPKAFEEFVADFLSAIGYDAQATPYVGDKGVDVVGTLDAQGLAKVLLRVQVKKTRGNVGIETVLKTRGALAADELGAIVSLGGFTPSARTEAEAPGKKTIALIEGDTLAEMVLEHWDELEPPTQQFLGIRPKERLPVQERFELAEVPPASMETVQAKGQVEA